MKRFRLIKKFPKSPELDTILEEKDLEDFEVNKFPEFWKEVLEEDYIIESYRLTTIPRLIYTRNIQRNVITYIYNGRTLNNYVIEKLENLEIFSVKRVIDQQIFSIGDEVVNPVGLSFTISRFYFDSLSKHILANGEGTDNGHVNVSKLKMAPKKMLFKTQDGIRTFTGDLVYFINNEWEIFPEKVSKERKNLYTIPSTLFFHSKEKAKNYITNNRPCLSIRDVCNIFQGDIIEGWVIQNLKKLVNEREIQNVK